MDELVMTQKLSLRDGMVRVAARSWWLRLLPIGLLEVQQLVDALKVHRREWLRNPPDLRTFHHELGAYTGNGAGTYWHAVRNRTDGYIEMSETNTEIRAYQHQTTKVARQTSLPFDTIDLGAAMSARFPGPINIESWRIQASRMIPAWVAALPQLRTWFDCFVDQTRIRNDDWLQFWAESVSPAEASRAWLRCAMFHLQASRRPNNGVAGDLAIASYLVDVDFFATKDQTSWSRERSTSRVSSVAMNGRSALD